MGVEEPSDLFILPKLTREELRISVLGISDRCAGSCTHCAWDLKPNGYQMEFSDIERIFSFTDLIFKKDRLVSTFGLGFDYKSNRKDISDVARLVFENGIGRFVIVTSGFSRKDKTALIALNGLKQFRDKVEVTLSFNLFQGKFEPYWDKIKYTVERLSEAGIVVNGSVVAFSKENETKTNEKLPLFQNLLSQTYEKAVLVNPTRSQFQNQGGKVIVVDTAQISRIGRAEGITRFEHVPAPLYYCKTFMIDDAGHYNLTIRSNGELTPCTYSESVGVPPFANVFEHNWEGIKARWDEYRRQFLRLPKTPEGSRCPEHRKMVFVPPVPSPGHLRQSSRALALAQA
ncbi:MAG: hypothetical protein V1909_03105 [Candidatus Micrarchaeota archaeon]